MVGSGLGSSRGSGGSFPSSHTRLPSLRKGKERVREALGERSGVPEGDVRPGSAMWSVMERMRDEWEENADCGCGAQAARGRTTSVWDAASVVIQVSAVASSLSGSPVHRLRCEAEDDQL